MLSTHLLILTLLSCLSYQVYGHYGCGADRIKDNIVIQNMNSKPVSRNKKDRNKYKILDGRAQDPDTSGDYENIRIHYDTSQLESDWSSFDLKDYFVDDVIPAAFMWLEKAIKVRPVDGALTFAVGCKQSYGGTQTNTGKCSEPMSNHGLCGDTGATIDDDMYDELEICSSGTQASSCETTSYPQGSGMSNTDLIIYFTGDATKDNSQNCENVMGFAAYCQQNSRNRPIGGYINLCKSTISDTEVLTWEEAISLIIHETFHVLGFSSDGFDNFVDADCDSDCSSRQETDGDVYQFITKRGLERAVITLPTVVEKAKEFFDCDSMDGIELENYQIPDNTASSHWENRIIMYDFMISYVPPAAPYSIFTLAVLADSGWYEIDWNYSQEPTYGRKAGCDWYDKKCIVNGDTIDDKAFCDETISYSCSSSYVGKFYCSLVTWNTDLDDEYQYFSASDQGGDNTYPDFCPLFEEYSNGDCRLYGDNNDGTYEDGETEKLGGFISGTSKCAIIGGGLNEIGASCYPTHCFKNSIGEYVGTRITTYRNFYRETFDVMTCWSDENEEERDFPYTFSTGENYGFTSIYCPVFEDICFDENPWICNGHGTIVDGSCVCSPGYMGRDCTIEANKDNRDTYDDTDSVSIYDKEVCNNGDDITTLYDDTEENLGILNINIENVEESTYVEEYFQEAVKNWIAILTDIPQCEVSLVDYVYNNSAVTTDIWYYATSKTWSDVSQSEYIKIFNNLFQSGNSISTTDGITEVKESAGTHENNTDIAAKISTYFVSIVTLLIFVVYVF